MIQKLASTFVQTVDSAALAIVVPLMICGFRERAAAIKRMCCRVVANMSKLVENPREALVFMEDLIPPSRAPPRRLPTPRPAPSPRSRTKAHDQAPYPRPRAVL
jgi:hypothetical protein